MDVELLTVVVTWFVVVLVLYLYLVLVLNFVLVFLGGSRVKNGGAATDSSTMTVAITSDTSLPSMAFEHTGTPPFCLHFLRQLHIRRQHVGCGALAQRIIPMERRKIVAVGLGIIVAAIRTVVILSDLWRYVRGLGVH